MKFKIKVENVGTGNSWWEDHDEEVSDAQKWAEEIVAWFNDTLRPGEKPRKLLEVEILGGE